MTANHGPADLVARARSEAVNQYANQLEEMEHRIHLGAMDAGPIPLILGGLYFVEIDLVHVLARAAKAEQTDPEPICGMPVGPGHCVKTWRHKDPEHWVLEG